MRTLKVAHGNHVVGALVVLHLALAVAWSQTKELRGVWYTPRISGGFVTQGQIAAAMDTIANNNFNTVFFLGWSQGFPLWRSKVFYDATGGLYWTDPKAGSRDLVAEAMVEAHRRGLEIEIWFEYGFVGGYSGNRPNGSYRGPLLDRNPGWRGRTSAGSDSVVINVTQSHYWMSHTHSAVQQFLIDLAKEAVEKYDIDGFELDRIRYPHTDWGYDSATVAIYRAEKGVDPPTNVDDAVWKRWRADKLNMFHKALYDSVKRRAPHVLVTDAPGHYSPSSYEAYENRLQDWAAWVNNDDVDAVHLQMYVSPSTLSGYIAYWKNNLITDPTKQKKVFPGVAVAPGGVSLPSSDFLSLIQIIRDQALLGNGIWYYEDLNRTDGGKTYWQHLKSGPYQQVADSPLRAQPGWRKPGITMNEFDPVQAETTGVWFQNNLLRGYFGPILQGPDTGRSTVTYYATVSEGGWYDFYAYIVGYAGLTAVAPYDLYDSSDAAIRITLNQTGPPGWTYAGTRFIRHGNRLRVARLSNEGIEQKKGVAAGGLMLLLNHRLSPSVIVSVPNTRPSKPESFHMFPAYPNPFNSETTVEYQLPKQEIVSITLFDILGRRIRPLVDGQVFKPGKYRFRLEADALTSGTYFVQIAAGENTATTKILLVR